MNDNLKPCPFCGDKAFLAVYHPHSKIQYHVIECSNCGIQSLPDSVPELIAFWNKRAYETKEKN